ncbi:MAG: EAL domain-containing protein, partial [Lysobacteraceae bacterium]
EIRWIESRQFPVHDPAGIVVRVSTIASDITQRKLAEQALEKSEDEFRSLAEAMPQIVWITRPDGWNIYFNQQWMEYTGLTLEQSIGHGWNAPFHPDDQQASWDAWENATKHRGTYSIESRLRSADGTYRWWLVRGVPLSDDSGNILKWFGTCTDIHDLKQAEFGVKRLNRVYEVLSEISALTVRVRNRDELFTEACRIAIELGGFRMAMIGMVDPATNKVIPQASAGKDEELLTVVRNILSSDEKASSSMVAKAIREQTAIISNDSANDPRLLLQEHFTQAGVRSLAILPLMVSGQAIGVLVLYASEKDFFHDEEMKLLNGLADDIAVVIDHIDRQARFDHFASYDQLTGLANRRLFLERLTQFTRSAVVDEHQLALFLIDLERFKNINDSLGQPAGDTLLQQVAQWLTQHLGDVNRVARVGADQFSVALPEAMHAGDVTRQLESMIEAFLGHPFTLNGDVYRIAAKFGVAIFPDDGADSDALLKSAETALKKAKAGGHRHLFYTQKMTETVAHRLNLENLLRYALEREEFVLHYQPKVNLASGEVTSVEALIRWNDPRTGLVPPGLFIPILEETGMIYEVGRWALRQSLQDHLRWCRAGLHAVRIAVNVSALQLRHPGFIGMVEQLLAIDAHAVQGLELEITESTIMHDMQQAISSLQAFRTLGIPIAIDDFGTGFSSLGYLSKLPIDTLKIDRMFVTGMISDPHGLSLVSTIINLAHSLQLKVVAEGVETEEESRLLKLLKCDEMQGYLFSKPVTTAVLEEKFLTRIARTT